MMSRYHKGLSSIPLRDSGYVEFAADDLSLRTLLREAIQDTEKSEDLPIGLQYDNQQQLLKLMSNLQARLPADDARSIQCRICYDDKQTDDRLAENKDGEDEAWIPLSELFGEVGGHNVSDYILHRLFTTHLQPVVQPSGNIIGYEFLLRPLPEQIPFRPAELFEKARRIGQHSFLDREARHSAIRMGAAHLQNGIKRFINFLPSSLHCPTACLKGTFEMMKETGTDPGDYVFEVMESEPLDDPGLLKVFDVYRQEGVRLALDDVGVGFANLDAVDRLQPDYVKMDRKWVSNCDTDTGKQRYIDELLDRVSHFHGVVLAEGLERQAEWDYLRKAGVSLFQGYLFGRATPVPAGIRVAVSK
ncbi:EAL domain-containing protein [Cohnella silvisoli]|uniref:EAL domain-containing protein n=1 Tax=Cohnella silvisoli TaxID=2873699 RepID=A0ABV1L4T4_9BACL|nr:EAL domain-containing protein [Cohnella silvisoli]MCD9026076.1 EAL domain-containing protein [Cohnella silvisoli]